MVVVDNISKRYGSSHYLMRNRRLNGVTFRVNGLYFDLRMVRSKKHNHFTIKTKLGAETNLMILGNNEIILTDLGMNTNIKLSNFFAEDLSPTPEEVSALQMSVPWANISDIVRILSVLREVMEYD